MKHDSPVAPPFQSVANYLVKQAKMGKSRNLFKESTLAPFENTAKRTGPKRGGG
jgi:hypothetical protein